MSKNGKNWFCNRQKKKELSMQKKNEQECLCHGTVIGDINIA